MKDLQNPLYRYKKLIFIFVIILLTVFVALSSRKDFETALIEMFNIKFESVIMLIILTGLIIYFDANILYHAIDDAKLNFPKALTINLAGSFFSGITPLYIGSYPSRVYYLYKSDVPIDKTLSALTVKGFTFQLVTTFFAVIGLLLGGSRIINNGGYLFFLIIGFVYNFCLATFLILISSSKKINNFFVKVIDKMANKINGLKKRKTEIMTAITNYYDNTQRMYKDFKYFFKVLINTIFKVGITYVIPIIVFYGLGFNIKDNWPQIFALASLMQMIVSVFPTPGGVAASEAVFIILYGLIFSSSTSVDAGVLIWRLFTYYIGIILGLIATLYLQAKEPANSSLKWGKEEK